MKYETPNIEVERSSSFRESSFKISEGNIAQIFNILRNQLYSDKEGAVIREYATNAIDAHKEANKVDVPIVITLPNNLESNFCIRDYGFGLSEEEIREIYVVYGESTKRETNDAIGQLGLGCKSGFAYTDNFTIISWHENSKKIYSAYIDETNCGKIALLTEEYSSEPSGIEIKIPVKKNDFQTFLEKTLLICQYFDLPPTIINGPPIKETKSLIKFEIEKNVFLSIENSQNWRDNGCLYVVMGGIGYLVNGVKEFKDFSFKFRSHKIVLTVRIGDIDITANRETIELTKKTISIIERYLFLAESIFLEKARKEILEEKTYKEASLKYREFLYNFKSDSLNKEIFYKGWELYGDRLNERIDKSRIDLCCYMISLSSDSNSKLDLSTPYNKIIENNVIFVVQDVRNYRQRIIYYLEKNNLFSCHYLINIKNKETNFKDISLNFHLKDYNIIFVKDLENPPKKRSLITSQRKIGKIFTLNENSCYEFGKRSNNWEEVSEISKEKKYYIYLYHFHSYLEKELSKEITKKDLILYKFFLNNFLDLKIEKIYGIKKNVKNLDSSWIPIVKKLEELKINEKFLDNYSRSSISRQSKEENKILRKIEKEIKNKEFLSYFSIMNKVELPPGFQSYFNMYNERNFMFLRKDNKRAEDQEKEYLKKRDEIKINFPLVYSFLVQYSLEPEIEKDLVKIINLL